MNAIHYFLGFHNKIIKIKGVKLSEYSNDPKKRDILYKLLDKTANFFGDFDPTKTTNWDKYFYALKEYVIIIINH